jgi:hypothetical protein
MTKRHALVGLLGALAAAPALAQAPEAQRLRRELRAMESLLDQTVEQVSRPNAGFALAGAPSSRGYRIRGSGVVFVLPPRRLPVPAMVLAQTNSGIVVIRGKPGGSNLRRAEAQVAEFQRQAQQEWYELERSFIEVQTLLMRAAGEPVPPAWGELPRGVPTDAAPVPVSRPEVDSTASAGGPPPAVAPAAPAPPAAPTPIEANTSLPAESGFLPQAPSLQPPAPPWIFWDDSAEEAEDRTPDRVVEDTRNALLQVLESHGHLLTSVPPDETISVVVDFVAGAPFLDDNVRPARSLSLRLRKRDLDEHRAGRLSAEELRRRAETAEY